MAAKKKRGTVAVQAPPAEAPTKAEMRRQDSPAVDPWEALNLASPQMLEQQRKAWEAAQAAAETFLEAFSSPAGEKVLQVLRRMTIEQAVLGPNTTPFGGGIREGQNSLVRFIEGQIRAARHPQGR